jgi:hypothetical protein
MRLVTRRFAVFKTPGKQSDFRRRRALTASRQGVGRSNRVRVRRAVGAARRRERATSQYSGLRSVYQSAGPGSWIGVTNADPQSARARHRWISHNMG